MLRAKRLVYPRSRRQQANPLKECQGFLRMRNRSQTADAEEDWEMAEFK